MCHRSSCRRRTKSTADYDNNYDSGVWIGLNYQTQLNIIEKKNTF